jgi:hypothetical protein
MADNLAMIRVLRLLERIVLYPNGPSNRASKLSAFARLSGNCSEISAQSPVGRADWTDDDY